jgi:hypothetical protein
MALTFPVRIFGMFDLVTATKMLHAELDAIRAEFKVLMARAEFALHAAERLRAKSEPAADQTQGVRHVLHS